MVTVELYSINDATIYYSTITTISIGSNSSLYFFDGITQQDGYYIRYTLKDSPNYFPIGYYNSLGTTYNENNSEIIDLTYSDFLNGDMTFLQKNVVAPNVNSNQSYTGNLTSADDVNYYSFSPTSTQNYICESSGNLDTYAVIFDNNMNEILLAANDDINLENWLVNFRIFTELEAGNTYYINDVSSLDKKLIVRSTKLVDSKNSIANNLTSNETISATVTVTNISDTKQTGSLFLILYNGKKVEKIQVIKSKVVSGETVNFVNSFKLPSIVAGKTLRAIFWNDATRINPYSRVICNIN